MIRPHTLLMIVATLASACVDQPIFEFRLPSGSELVIEQTTETERRGHRGIFLDSVTVVTRAMIIEGGVVGRDTIKLSNRVVRVIVDRRRSLDSSTKVLWDSAIEPPPRDREFELEAVILNLSYGLVISPDFTTAVTNWHAPGEKHAPARELSGDDGPIERETLDQQGTIAELSLAFRVQPVGRHAVGSIWSARTLWVLPRYRTKSTVDDVGSKLLRIKNPQYRTRVATDVDWSLRSLEKGVALLRFTAEVAPRSRLLANQSGKLRYDTANKRPIERSASSIEHHGDYRTETTHTVRYRIE